ncbi:MAG: alkaline phosphatase family protein [Coleofasciculus sp. G1-WW12-02]|uniref:alkaline phosphatase family protein n=1 Tax=Coleofasciculus sp. G1-WW12-02 TaxID=3068483 RepID=UPI00330041F6
MSKAKIFFIGLDGADRDLILQWAEAGLLQTFQSLLQQGAFGLTNDPPGINGCHWPTFFSGVSPAKHGRYWAQQIQPGTYDIGTFSFGWEPFWNVLSQAGRKIALVDAPEAPLAESLNGIQIVERHNYKQGNSSVQTYPLSLAAEIETQLGKNSIGSLRTVGRGIDELKDFRQNLLTSIEKKIELSSHFIKQGEWDLFLTAFREAHWAGHQCWHLHDPNHPEYDQEVVNAIGNPMKDIYIAIDAAIGKLLQQVSPETTVFIFASTGMGPNYTGVHVLDEILLRIENPQRAAMRQEVGNTLNSLKRYKFLRQLKKRLWKPIQNIRGTGKPPISKLSNRKCFQVPSSEAFGGIRINLVGREPQGKIQPGQEYEEFCEALCQDLSELTNYDTGEPLIRNIFRSAEIYKGEHPMGHPDLLVEWNRNAPIASVYSPKVGKIDKVYWDSRTGDHKPGGLFLVSGASIEPKQVEQPTSIVDFAPTIASLLEVPLPTSDGQPISGIFSSAICTES